MHLGFGLLMRLLIPNTASFLPERITAAIPILLFLVLAQFVRVIAAKFDWFAKILAYLFYIHYFDLILKSSTSLVYVSGSMMVLTALAPIFSTFQSLQSFARVSHDLKNPLIFLTAQLSQVTKEADPDILRPKLEEVSIKHKIRTSLAMGMMREIIHYEDQAFSLTFDLLGAQLIDG